MSEKEKAKKYLGNRQFRVSYFLISPSSKHQEEKSFYDEEYPDFIPHKGDMVVFNNESYMVNNIAHCPEENKVYVVIMTERDYESMHQKY